jgi:hypothetical protein
VTLESKGKTYRVHTAKQRAVVCADSKINSDPENAAPIKLVTLQLKLLTENSKADLAQKLGVSAKDIKVKSIDKVNWKEASLGCPKAGVSYTQTDIPGCVLWLEFKGRVFEYHRSTRIFFPCPAIESE